MKYAIVTNFSSKCMNIIFVKITDMYIFTFVNFIKGWSIFVFITNIFFTNCKLFSKRQNNERNINDFYSIIRETILIYHKKLHILYIHTSNGIQEYFILVITVINRRTNFIPFHKYIRILSFYKYAINSITVLYKTSPRNTRNIKHTRAERRRKKRRKRKK